MRSLATVLFTIVAVAFPLWRGVIDPLPEVDFRYYWFAGVMWANGLDPYSADYARLGNQVLPPGAALHVWLYPPPWFGITRLLAAMNFDTALLVWRASVGPIIVASTAIVAQSAFRRDWLAITGVCALAAVIEPTVLVLVGGQVSPILVYAGMALIVSARTKLPLVAGLVLTALKPQIGAFIFLAYAIAQPRAVIMAVAVTAVLSLPHFLTLGLIDTITEYLDNLRATGQHYANVPIAMTGLGQLPARLGINIPGLVSFAAATAVAVTAGIGLRQKRDGSLAFLLAGIAAIVPLHNYDLTFMVLPVLLLFPSGAAIAATLLALRPMRLEAFLGVPVHADASGGTIFYAVAAITLFVAATYQLSVREWRRFELAPQN